MADPLDMLRALGWRVILVPDFDGLVCLVTDESIVLVDADADPQAAADCALDLIADAPAHTS